MLNNIEYLDNGNDSFFVFSFTNGLLLIYSSLTKIFTKSSQHSNNYLKIKLYLLKTNKIALFTLSHDFTLVKWDIPMIAVTKSVKLSFQATSCFFFRK